MNEFKNAKIAKGLPSTYYYNEPPLPFGFIKHNRARRDGKGILSKEDVKEIRNIYDNTTEKTNDVWFLELAEKFEVSITCVKDCARRKTFQDE